MTIQENCCMAMSASVFGPVFVSLKLKNRVRDSSKQMCGYLMPRHQRKPPASLYLVRQDGCFGFK